MVVPKWAHASSLCPPLGLAYLAASIREAGFSVRCLDALGENPLQQIVLDKGKFLSFGLSTPEIVDRIGECDILGVSLMFSHDWPVAKSIIRAIRQRYPHLTIIAGGEHVTAAPEFCLKDCSEIDICVLGEGEETIVDLLRALAEKRPLSSVNGIVYRAPEGTSSTPRRGRIRALDQIKWPAWDLFPLENYLSNELGYGVNPGRSVPILASRGCPFECTFCSNPLMWTTRWQARKVDEVLSEMQYYIDKYDAQNFDFYDLTTIIRKDWTIEFCQKIIQRGWKITWQMPAGTRSEALDGEVLHLMSLSGQKNISYAPESGSPTSLKKIKKKITLSTMEGSISSALAEGMNVKLNMIMGFPFETRKELVESLGFLARMAKVGVHDAYIACFSPYPGSELFNELVAAGRIGALDDDYFLMLTSYSDMRYSFSYSPHLSNRALTLFRLGGMAMFYGISYVTHPTRLGRMVWNVMRGKEESRLDMALGQLVSRLRSKKIDLDDVRNIAQAPPPTDASIPVPSGFSDATSQERKSIRLNVS
jgi:anaerobic magnesium-protoporphyrin IX monomethyl ester cyclase